MTNNSQKTGVKIVRKLGAVIALSVAVSPIICDGKKCSPITSPDLLSEGGFSYDNAMFMRGNIAVTSSFTTSAVISSILGVH